MTTIDNKKFAFPMASAPTDATMVLLLVDYTADDAGHALDDQDQAWTLGFNNDSNVGEDEGNGWQFAGWCWSHDHFTDGRGKPIGWLPFAPMVDPSLAKYVAEYLESEADACKSGAGLSVPQEALDWAGQRLRAIAGNVRAGLHWPDQEPKSESEAAHAAG